MFIWYRNLLVRRELQKRCEVAFAKGKYDREHGIVSGGPYYEGTEDHEAWGFGYHGYKGFYISDDLQCKVKK